MPYIQNITTGVSTWVNWPSAGAAISNSSDPVSGNISLVNTALPWLLPVFLGGIYVMLWLLFRNSPSKYKLVSITLLVFVISFFMAAFGLTADALLNFAIFALAYFITYLFKGY